MNYDIIVFNIYVQVFFSYRNKLSKDCTYLFSKKYLSLSYMDKARN